MSADTQESPQHVLDSQPETSPLAERQPQHVLDNGTETALVSSAPQGVASWLPDRNPVRVYLGRLGPGSQETMLRALQVVAELLQGPGADPDGVLWPALRYQHVARLRQLLDARYKPGTTNRILCAVRGVLKECWRLEYMGAEDYHRAVDVPAIAYEVLPAGRALPAGDLVALFDACAKRQNRAAGARDAALLSLQYGVLLRRAEVASLLLSEVVDGTVQVKRGKGRRERIGHMPAGTRSAVEAWLRYRGVEEGPLLGTVNKGGSVTPRQLGDTAIHQIYQRMAPLARIRSFSSHDLRRTGITDLLDRGADVILVARMAGHKQVTTTQRYDLRQEVAKRRAAELLHVPFVEVA